MARGRFVHGFSLVELMAAAAIMGILVSLALPRYRLFMARSRMAEAKVNLGIIYGLQQSYKAEFEKFGRISGGMGHEGDDDKCDVNNAGQHAKNELGFRVTDCFALRYLYRSEEIAGANASSRDGSNCTEIYPNCATSCADKGYDEWLISDRRKLTHLHNIVPRCSDSD